MTLEEFKELMVQRSMEDEGDEFERMSDAQVTLFLARNGLSPEDVERSLDKLMTKLEAVKKESVKP